MHRRRRLHRPVGGAVRQVARPGTRRRAARGDPLRRRRERAQRRLRPVLAHPRDRQRPVALPRRDRPHSSGSGARTSTRWREDLDELGDRRRVRARRRSHRRARAARAGRPRRGGRAGAPLRPRRRAARRASRSAPQVELAAVPRRPVDPDRVRAGPSRQARRRPARGGGSAPACASTSTRPVRALRKTAAASRLRPTAGWSTPAACCWPRAPTRRCVPRDRPLRRAGLRLRAGHRADRPAPARPIGWRRRQGSSDMGNQFHYYRLTADWRILWGGYDAVYRYGGPVGPHLDDHEPTFAMLSQHFFTAVPAARGRALQPSLGRRDRHLQPLLGVLRPSAGRTGRVRARLHRARRGGQPLRRAAWGSTSSTAARPRRPRWPWCAGARFRSRPSRCAAR